MKNTLQHDNLNKERNDFGFMERKNARRNANYIGAATLGLAVLTSGTVYYFYGENPKESILPRSITTQSSQSTPVPRTIESQLQLTADNFYVVQKGDSLSQIAFNMGFRGKDIYKEVLRIQELNNLSSEGDTHMMIYMIVDGRLVKRLAPGKDGLVDKLKIGQKLRGY